MSWLAAFTVFRFITIDSKGVNTKVRKIQYTSSSPDGTNFFSAQNIQDSALNFFFIGLEIVH